MPSSKTLTTSVATQNFLAGCDTATATSVLAAQAITLANLVDHADPAVAVSASRELRMVMDELKVLAKPKEADGVDELRSRRANRGAGATRSDRARVRKQPS